MNFLNTLPIDATAVSSEDWVRYVACILQVCASDGLSETETRAVQRWLADHQAPPSTFDAALRCSGDSAESLVGTDSFGELLGPYLVRDAIRMAKVDGIDDVEMSHVYRLGRQVGLDVARVDAVRRAIDAYEAAGTHWHAATAR